VARYIDTDVLVIGGGGAAGRAALEASLGGARVAMVMKGRFGKCGATAYKIAEMAGYNFADGSPDPEDSPAEHLKDILAAAAGTCDERLAAILAEEAPRTIRDLEAWGVPLVKDGDRYLAVVGCFASRPRMHVVPGHAEPILAALVEQLRARDVAIYEDTLITVPSGTGIDNAKATFRVEWPTPVSDYDMKVYKADAAGNATGDPVAVSGNGATSGVLGYEEAAVLDPRNERFVLVGNTTGAPAGCWLCRSLPNIAFRIPYRHLPWGHSGCCCKCGCCFCRAPRLQRRGLRCRCCASSCLGPQRRTQAPTHTALNPCRPPFALPTLQCHCTTPPCSTSS